MRIKDDGMIRLLTGLLGYTGIDRIYNKNRLFGLLKMILCITIIATLLYTIFFYYKTKETLIDYLFTLRLYLSVILAMITVYDLLVLTLPISWNPNYEFSIRVSSLIICIVVIFFIFKWMNS